MSYKRLASVLKTSYKRSKTQKVVYVIATQTTFCLSFSLMISTNSQGDRSSAGDWPRVAVAKPKRYFVIMLLCYYGVFLLNPKGKERRLPRRATAPGDG